MVYIEITLNSLLPQNNCYPCTSLLEPAWPLLGISRHPFYNKIEFVVPQILREADQIPKCCIV